MSYGYKSLQLPLFPTLHANIAYIKAIPGELAAIYRTHTHGRPRSPSNAPFTNHRRLKRTFDSHS